MCCPRKIGQEGQSLRELELAELQSGPASPQLDFLRMNQVVRLQTYLLLHAPLSIASMTGKWSSARLPNGFGMHTSAFRSGQQVSRHGYQPTMAGLTALEIGKDWPSLE